MYGGTLDRDCCRDPNPGTAHDHSQGIVNLKEFAPHHILTLLDHDIPPAHVYTLSQKAHDQRSERMSYVNIQLLLYDGFNACLVP